MKKSDSFKEPFKSIDTAFVKLRTGKTLDPREKKSLVNFIDDFTTVSLCPAEVGKAVVDIAKEVNHHHHTQTCRKHETICRFNYPKYPIWKTVVAEPYEAEFEEEKDKNLKFYKSLLEKVQAVLEDEEVVASIMEKYDKPTETLEEYETNRKKRILELLDKAKVPADKYLTALSYTRAGYTYHMKRDLDECYINSYNKEWIRAWNGNLDLQICMDFFQVITYITEYYQKFFPELEELIQKVLQENPDDSVKERMKLVASTFLTHRQIGEAEGYYKLLPDLLLKNSNVTTQWLFVGRKDEKYKRMKRAEKSEEKNPNLITLEGVDGKWYEQPDMLSKYKRRPESLENMCYTQFGKMFRSGGKPKAEGEEEVDDLYDDEDLDNCEDQNEENDPEKSFHYIMTEDDDMGVPLPNWIKLQDPYPKENPMMQKRSRPVAIRFHKVNRNNSPHKFFLSELMMYIAFRDEEEEFRPDDTDFIENFYIENEDRIRSIKKKVMEHLENVEEARYFVEEAVKKLNLEDVGANLDAAKEQADADDEYDNLIREEHPDYDFLNTDNVDLKEKDDLKETHIYSKVNIPDIRDLKKKTRQLDIHQRRVVDIAIKYARDLLKARKEGNKKPDPPMVMVHGGAGSGKSYVIQLIAEWVHYILQKEGDSLSCPYVLKTAFTGTAASLIEGMTLHSAFGFDFGNKHYSLSDKIRDMKKGQFKNLEIVIVDEVSMMKSDMNYQLDLRLQEVKEKPGVPYGGVSIFFFGDLMQLCPVQGKFVFEPPQNDAFKITHELQSRWKMMDVINLEKNHRQGRFKEYADMLNRIRIGQQTEEDLELLRTRIRPTGHKDLESVSLNIVCKRKLCAKHNTAYLNQLEGETITIKATNFIATRKTYRPKINSKDGTIGNTQFMDTLLLKLESKVILIYNVDTADGLTNGQLGILKGFVKNVEGKVVKMIVEFRNKNVGSKNRQENANLLLKYPDCTVIEKVSMSYKLSKKSTNQSATLIQFPIKLAQAITAHKIQGQSIYMPLKVALDISSVFDDAQAYVMLSRVEDLEQVYIFDELKKEKIRPDMKALRELKQMNERSLNANPIPWNTKKEKQLKIAHLNCMNLINNHEDVKDDPTLRESDLLALVETWLTNESVPIIGSYASHSNNAGPGKGITIYYKEKLFKHVADITDDRMQLTKMTSITTRLDIITVYRSSDGNLTKLMEYLQNLIDPNKTTVVCGDINLCYLQTGMNKVTKFLENQGFSQLVKWPTHNKGRLIDHLYLKHIMDGSHSLHRHSPYFSDHDAICLTIEYK